MKKKNLGLIITISIVAVILVIVGIFTSLYFMTDIFKTNQEIFWKYVGQGSQISNIVTSENEKSQEQWQESNSYTSEGNLKVAITKQTGTQEVNAKTTSKHNQSNGRTYSDIAILNGEEELIKFSYINNQDIYAFYCKDIFEPYYIGIRNSNLREFAIKMGISEEIVAQLPDFIETKKDISVISDEDKQYLSTTYFEIIKNAIKEEKYSKTKKTDITINNTNYNVNGYQLVLSEEEIRQVVIDVLSKAKEDQKTIEILRKLIPEVENDNMKMYLTQAIDTVQSRNVRQIDYTITVYPVGNKKVKIHVNRNNEVEVALDIDSSNKDKETFAFRIGDVTDQKNSLQLTVEKQILNNMTNYTTNCINNMNDYRITMNTSLGNVIDNKIENNSKITIIDNDATIETSYYKTIQKADQEAEIEELTNNNAVIINNYPKEQLQGFFSGIEEKANNVISEKIGKLNISLSNSQDSAYYSEGIVASIINIINVNRVPQPIGVIAVTAITTLNQIAEIENKNQINTNQTISEQALKAFNSNYELYKGEQAGSNVRSLCDFIKTSNSLSPDTQQVYLQMGKIEEKIGRLKQVNESDITEIENKILLNKKYNVTIGYDNDNCVAGIGIEEIE